MISVNLALFFIALAILLLALAGAYAASEAALASVSKAELLELAERHKIARSSLKQIIGDESSHMNASVFARILTETLAAVLITLLLASVIPNIWIVLCVAAIILAAASFVLVGVSPRTVGTYYADRVLVWTAPLLRGTCIMLSPLVKALLWLGSFISARTKQYGQEVQNNRVRGEQRILALVDRAAERNLLEEADREYIHSVVEFHATLVREAMVPRTDMEGVSAELSLKDVFERIQELSFSRVPVLDETGESVLGIVYFRDLAQRVYELGVEGAQRVSVRECMRAAMFVPDLMRASDLLQQMRSEAVHVAITVDEYGGVSGLVTLEDLIEEIIGEIYDEHDNEQADIVENEDGSFLIVPRLDLDSLADLFDVTIEDEDTYTVAGLVVKELGRLARSGDKVEVSGIELEVLSVNRRHAIQLIRARRGQGAEAGADGLGHARTQGALLQQAGSRGEIVSPVVLQGEKRKEEADERSEA